MHNGKNDWQYWTTYIQDKNNTVWKATLNVAESANGVKYLYDIDPIEKVGQSVKSDTSTTSVGQSVKSDTGYCSTEPDGKSSTNSQLDAFRPGRAADRRPNGEKLRESEPDGCGSVSTSQFRLS